MNGSFIKNRILWLNVAFWLLFFSYKFYDFSAFMGKELAFKRIAVPMFFHIVLCYAHYFFILPDLLRTKRFLRYLSRLIPVIGVIMFFQAQAENYYFAELSRGYYQSFGWARFVSTLWDQLSFMIFTGMIKFAADWFELENKKKELENQKLTAELNYLKAQINPHFLFNTLHNLNYLTQTKAAKATEVIIKLSNIMRYMIYDANKITVPIQKEIHYIKDYLDLEQLRLNNQFDIRFDISIESKACELTPLLLIPFVENAFKHGIHDLEPKGWIHIDLSQVGSTLYFIVENSIVKKGATDNESSGFGLGNVKKRLELSYPNQYELRIEENSERFFVNLSLEIE